MSSNVSRRNFIAGALAGATSLAATSLIGCAPGNTAPAADDAAAPKDAASASLSETGSSFNNPPWLGTKPEIADEDVEAEIAVDVLIVGAGVSGVAAARSASEEGAQVAVFEKAAGPQCRSGEYAVIGGVQARWGRDDIDPEIIIEDHMRECGNSIKRPILARWAYECGDVFDWWIAAKPDLYICETTRDSVPDEHADCFLTPCLYPLPEAYDWTREAQPTFPSSVEFIPSQEGIVTANMDKALSQGVQAYFGHFVEALISEGGRVTGLYARNAETGKYVKARATGGVILAAGDYASNEEMFKFYRQDLIDNGVVEMWMNMDVEGNPTNTGDGYKLAMWEGAKIQQEMHAPCNHAMGTVGCFGVPSVPGPGIAAFLQLNKDGKRFMNEDGNGQSVEHQLELTRDRTSYQLFDSSWPEQVPFMQAAHGCVCYFEEGPLPKNNEFGRNYANLAGFEAGVEEGTLLKADTVEELLDMIDIDKETALASIANYNEMAHAGRDTEYGKRADRLFPLENGPFYCATFGPNPNLVLFGGVESDENCHAYSTDRTVIPGLYVCGNMQGNRFAIDYPISLKGCSHSMAMFYGYIAGKNAVTTA